MIEGVLDGISQVIARGFPGYPVYGDSRVRQGLETPCFFVGLGACNTAPLPGGLLGVRQAVDVVYFPENQEDYGEMWGVGPQVLPLLAVLTLPDGSRLRGTGLRCDVEDGLMHMRAVYRLRLIPVEHSKPMETLALRVGLGR